MTRLEADFHQLNLTNSFLTKEVFQAVDILTKNTELEKYFLLGGERFSREKFHKMWNDFYLEGLCG